jgi:hypothetical protein
MQQPINNNKQQTAVEWLVEQLRMQTPLYTKEQIIEQAKELEKEQINEAFKHGEFWILQTIAEAVNNTTTKPITTKL